MSTLVPLNIIFNVYYGMENYSVSYKFLKRIRKVHNLRSITPDINPIFYRVVSYKPLISVWYLYGDIDHSGTRTLIHYPERS